MNYTLENVTEDIEAWSDKDPVRPELSDEFRTEAGREVFGLTDDSGEFKAFLCMARTTAIPIDTKELDSFTAVYGSIAVPYSVWSYQKGAGREIINQVLALMIRAKSISRVITLSPITDMARRFHLKNNAVELSVNEEATNFEYLLI